MAERPPATPLFWFTAGLLSGQALAPWLSGHSLPLASCLAAFAALIARRGNTWAVAFVAVAIGHAQLDALLRPTFPPHHVQRWADSTVELRGQIAARPAERPAGRQLLVDVAEVRRGDTWQPATGRLLVTVRAAVQPWRWGDRVGATVRLHRPRNFGNPGEFDYEAYLARRRVYVTGFALSDRSWRRAENTGYNPARLLERWRSTAAQAIRGNISPPARQIAAALLLGEAGALERDIRDRYARAGVSHVLAISGLHVGLVAAAAYAAARWLLARSQWLLLRANVPKLAMTSSALPVLWYAALAGGSVATARATAMVLLVVSASLLNRQRDWLACLVAAAAGISLWWPGSLFEISFQLSFAAVLSIVLGLERVTRRYEKWEEAYLVHLRYGPSRRFLRWLVLSQAVTVCALLGTAPLTAWHFNRLSLVAPLANAVAVPVLGFLSVSGGLIATLAAPFAPPLSARLFQAVGALIQCGDYLVSRFAALPGAALRVVSPSLPELVLLYGLLAALLIRQAPRRRFLLGLCAVALAADAGYWYAERFHRDTLRLTFLSVGQGDSTLIEFPGAAVMVVDGGGLSTTFDVGERVIAPYLWRRKIRRLDTMVLSHPDFDHYGGLGFLAAAFDPVELWWTEAPGSGELFARFCSQVRTRGTPSVRVRRGFHRLVGGVHVSAVHPSEQSAGSSNDQSLSLLLRYGPTTVLLPGDLEVAGEKALVAQHRNLESTIVKVPHHGSRSSSTTAFLRAVAPRLAVVSSGYRNRFKMPHPDVLAAYQARGARLWRTDMDGAVIVEITARGGIQVTTGRGGRPELVVWRDERPGKQPAESPGAARPPP